MRSCTTVSTVSTIGSPYLGSAHSLGAITLCVVLWLPMVTAWAYNWARLFDTETTALGLAIMVNVFGGMIFVVAYMVLLLISRVSSDPNPIFLPIMDAIVWVGGLLVPGVSLGIAFQALAFYQNPVFAYAFLGYRTYMYR